MFILQLIKKLWFIGILIVLIAAMVISLNSATYRAKINMCKNNLRYLAHIFLQTKAERAKEYQWSWTKTGIDIWQAERYKEIYNQIFKTNETISKFYWDMKHNYLNFLGRFNPNLTETEQETIKRLREGLESIRQVYVEIKKNCRGIEKNALIVEQDIKNIKQQLSELDKFKNTANKLLEFMKGIVVKLQGSEDKKMLQEKIEDFQRKKFSQEISQIIEGMQKIITGKAFEDMRNYLCPVWAKTKNDYFDKECIDYIAPKLSPSELYEHREKYEKIPIAADKIRNHYGQSINIIFANLSLWEEKKDIVNIETLSVNTASSWINNFLEE